MRKTKERIARAELLTASARERGIELAQKYGVHHLEGALSHTGAASPSCSPYRRLPGAAPGLCLPMPTLGECLHGRLACRVRSRARRG
jgi:hypothetical protein